MALQLQSAALIGFAALMIIAAFEDLRRLVIPNVVPLCVCVLWPLYIVPTASVLSVAGSIGCAAIVFMAGALFFSRGFLGGGDVKLLTAATLWAGPGLAPSLLLATGVLGGALALILLVPPCAHLATLARVKLGEDTATTPTRALATPVPYGIAIAAAALLVLFIPHFR
ncbi:MAG TPA: A24 family peptidase [Stellaceae bacterium]|nr:A24 family peptidase [Stellaceae bacterium]